jgi:hypothetical protein
MKDKLCIALIVISMVLSVLVEIGLFFALPVALAFIYSPYWLFLYCGTVPAAISCFAMYAGLRLNKED